MSRGFLEEGRGRKTLEAVKANPRGKSFAFQADEDAPTEGDRCFSTTQRDIHLFSLQSVGWEYLVYVTALLRNFCKSEHHSWRLSMCVGLRKQFLADAICSRRLVCKGSAERVVDGRHGG